jgi:oxidase EvaA
VADVLPLLQQNNMVNTDARSVIACWLTTNPRILQQCLPADGSFAVLHLGSLRATSSQHSWGALHAWLDDLNRRSSQLPREMALSDLRPHWLWHGGTFESTRKHVLQVHHISVECATREVTGWDQPILATRTLGKLATVTGLIDGVQHFLLQARLEAGSRQGFEITTTIQADSADDMSDIEKRYADTCDTNCTRLLHFENSEEGGRFDHCISEYEVYWSDDPRRIEESPLHRWISLRQLANWMREPNRLTNELRSTVSALLSVND